MRIASIIERLAARVPALKLAGGAASFERSAPALTTMPAAFVLPARETASANPFAAQLVQQEVTAEFVVLIAVRNLADDEGAAALEALAPVREAVLTALLGWVPDDAEAGCEYVAGDLLQFANGVIWWQDTYSTNFIVRSA